MRKLATIFILLFSGYVSAEATILTCKYEDGSAAGTLTVDMDAMNMVLSGDGALKEVYDIVHVEKLFFTAVHISGKSSTNSSGGDILLINRLTGKFVKASASRFVDPDNKDGDANSPLYADTYEGHCYKQLL